MRLMTQFQHNFNKPGPGCIGVSVGFLSALASPMEGKLESGPNTYLKDRVSAGPRHINLHHRWGDERLPASRVWTVVFNAATAGSDSPYFPQASPFLLPVLSSRISAAVSTALYLQSNFFSSSLCLTHLLPNSWPPPSSCNQSLL